MKRIMSLIVVVAMMLSSLGVFAAESTAPTFNDVDSESVLGQSIYKLVNAGVLNGYTDGTFRPNNPLTRAELCKIVNLVFNYTEAAADNFTDVSANDWFYSYVAIAKKAGYITGHGDGTFKGNDYLTREQACAIITRVTELFDLTMSETITDTVSDWAVPYVNKVVSNRLMPLEAGGKFRATENITRGELTSVMALFVDEKPKDNNVSDTTSGKGTPVPSVKGGSYTSTQKVVLTTDVEGATIYYTTNGNNPTEKSTKYKDAISVSKSMTIKAIAIKDGKVIGEVLSVSYVIKSAAGGGGGGSSGGSTIDMDKQNQVVASLKNMQDVLSKESFSVENGEKAVINYVLDAVKATLDDANRGIAIYGSNYIKNTYRNKIESAFKAYEDMTEENQSGFESKLLALKNKNYNEVNELSKILFGISIDDLIDIATDDE